MEPKKKPTLGVEIAKGLFVVIPKFLAEKMLLGIERISDARYKAVVYVFLVPCVATLLYFIKWVGGVLIGP